MKLFTNLNDLEPKVRPKVARFLRDKAFRTRVQKHFQDNGKGVGLDPDNLVKWLELILKFLPLFLALL